MANKLPWFTHDHNARNDEFIQRSMDQFGHFGYAAYFMILELIHEHGNGGVVTIPKSRLALNLRSRWPQVLLYLTFSQTSGKVQFTLSGDEVQLQNKKFIERQRKSKVNAPPMLRQCSTNAPIYIERDRERDKDTPLPPKGDAPGFDSFWKAYPHKIAKKAALAVWNKLKPNDATQAEILAAIAKQSLQDAWKRDGGKYIPHPRTWLNQERWKDEIKGSQQTKAETFERTHIPPEMHL